MSIIITNEKKGFRDLYWCPNLNEPFIIQFRYKKLYCPNCASFEHPEHIFIGHINNTNEKVFGTDIGDKLIKEVYNKYNKKEMNASEYVAESWTAIKYYCRYGIKP